MMLFLHKASRQVPGQADLFGLTPTPTQVKGHVQGARFVLPYTATRHTKPEPAVSARPWDAASTEHEMHRMDDTQFVDAIHAALKEPQTEAYLNHMLIATRHRRDALPHASNMAILDAMTAATHAARSRSVPAT